MTHTYNLTGISCMSCVAKIKSALLSLPDVTSAEVSRDPMQAVVTMERHIPLPTLQKAVATAGNYTITEDASAAAMSSESAEKSFLSTYYPLLLIAAFLLGAVLLRQLRADTWDAGEMMYDFMGGFFIVFSFFKLLDVKGFANSYRMYDVVAKAVPAYGFVYPFIELALGIAFLMRWNLPLTNAATLLVMGVSIIGVLRSVLRKQAIQCACLGTVFKLPMSSVTIIEDGLMIVMSGAMLAMSS